MTAIHVFTAAINAKALEALSSSHWLWRTKLQLQLTRRFCGSWLAVDRKILENDLDQYELDCRAIGWAAQTTTFASSTSVAVSLVCSIGGPFKALIAWVAHLADSTYIKFLPAILRGAINNPVGSGLNKRNAVDLTSAILPMLHIGQLNHTSGSQTPSAQNVDVMEVVATVDVIIWLYSSSYYVDTTPCFSHISTVLKVLDVVGHEQYVVPMMQRMLQGLHVKYHKDSPAVGKSTCYLFQYRRLKEACSVPFGDCKLKCVLGALRSADLPSY